MEQRARPRSGSYTVAGGEPQHAKLTFLKQAEGWTVDAQFAIDQIPEAHPDAEPAADSRAAIKVLVARWLEAHVHAERPGVGVVYASFMYSYGDEYARSRLQFRYLDQEEETKIQLALRKADDGWEVMRPLEEGETLNDKTGEIEAR